MKDTILTNLFQRIKQHRTFFLISCIVLTFLYFFACCYNKAISNLGYQASAKLYPLVMTRCQDQTSEACVNPCYMLKRVLGSFDYQQILSQNEQSFARQFTFYETDDHCIEINSCAKDAETALLILNTAIQQSNAICWEYTSSSLTVEQGYKEAIVKDYYKLNQSYLDSFSTTNKLLLPADEFDLQGQVLCFDIIDSPHIESSPSYIPLIVASILSILVAVCFSGLFVWLYSNLKHNE